MMGRKTKHIKPLIYVFCEGESEQVYSDFLKETFKNVAVIKRPNQTGIFEVADAMFKKNPNYRDYKEVTDEIWFFFDTEDKDKDKWDSRLKIMKNLSRKHGKEKIKIRLLMTKACIEYWLLLHYKKTNPDIQTPEDKLRITNMLKKYEASYEKGDKNSTYSIASNYQTAVLNSKQILSSLSLQGIPTLEDNDERNKWLYSCSKTFSTVHEAIEYLQNLNK